MNRSFLPDRHRDFDDDITFFDDIEAYAGALSCRAGEPMPVHVSTHCDRYSVVVERWGATRHVVWSAEALPGLLHPVPDGADAHGCDWPASFEVPTAVDWATGFYLVTLTAEGAAEGRQVAHAGFVVRPAQQTRRGLLVLATNTWNAYNTWGGNSLYTGGHQVSFRRPWCRGLLDRPHTDRDDRKAGPRRFGEESDVDGEIFQRYRLDRGYSPAIGSTGWFTHERRFVEWAESDGWSFDYAVSSDLDTEGALDGYDVVFSVGHDEYWTAAGRDAIDGHLRKGGTFVSLSGNTMFWQVRLVDDTDEVVAAGAHMICHKYRAHLDDPALERDPTTIAGLWCDPLVQRPEWTTIGAGSVFGLYHRFGRAVANGVGGFTVFRPDHWLVEETGLGYGDVLGADHGVVGYETVGIPLTFDEEQLPQVRPGHDVSTDLDVVGLAWSSNLGVGDYPKSISALSDQGDLEFLAERYLGEASEKNKRRLRHGNAVMLAGPLGGGQVITVGSTDWVFGLADDWRVAQVTRNIMRRTMGA